METHIVLLRGINVGRAKRVAMADLRKVLGDLGYTDVRTVRDELKLNRPDAGWFQVRTALGKRNASGDTTPVNFAPFELAYQTLTEKLKPQVFSLGFLR